MLFLSTLSLRRATRISAVLALIASHFYPRSPCGERLFDAEHLRCQAFHISIHALLAESDQQLSLAGGLELHFYPRSPCGERRAAP